MLNNHRNLSKVILSATSLIALSTSGSAWAQSAGGTDASDDIVVTGSRLERNGGDSPIPVTIVGREQLDEAGITAVDQIATDIPALGESNNSQNNFGRNGDVGVSTVNLRGLGANRTLVLVDGRRHVGGVAGDTTVDLNTVPAALVERIEVSTGGASVAYGADGVSGVVNIILRNNFQGVQLDSQAGVTSRGDGASQYVSLLAGKNFGGGRGNITLAASYNNQGAIAGKDRGFIRDQPSFGVNPANQTTTDGIPAQILFLNVRSNTQSPSGVLTGRTNSQRYTFDSNGALIPYDFGTNIGANKSVGGDGLDLSRFETVQSPIERAIFEARAHYELASYANFFIDAKYVHNRGLNQGQGIPDTITVRADNPFLPTDSRITALFAANPAGVQLIRHTDDLGGIRARLSERNTYRLVTGFNGDIPGTKLNYEAYYQFGRTDVGITDLHNRLNRRFNFAVDAVTDIAGVTPGSVPGSAACRATVAAYTANRAGSGDPDIDLCKPLNLFGPNRASKAAKDFVSVDLFERDRLQQQVANLTVNGELFRLPAGAVQVAAGIEWRKEQSRSQPDNLSILNLVVNGQALPIKGSYTVLEGFGELAVPLLHDLPMIKSLSIEGGVRFSDYSTTGASTSWRVGGEYSPFDGLRFRGGYSVAVRAPNIGELFTPQVVSSSGVNDPCDASRLDLGPNPTQRRANCALLVPAGFRDPTAGISKPTIDSGNPNLREEKAKSITAGMVFQPTFLRGFTATVDYFDIRISDAVQIPRVQEFADSCVDFFTTINNDFCAKITRGANGAITLVQRQAVNVASFKTRGIDFDLGYRFQLSDIGLPANSGSMRLRLYGTYLDRLDIRGTADRNLINANAGELASPHWRFNVQAAYHSDPFSFSWSLRYLGAAQYDVQDNPIETQTPQGFGAQFYHDVQARIGVEDRFTLILGVNNLFDKQPPYGSRLFTTSAPVLYEQIGRYMYAGVRVRL